MCSFISCGYQMHEKISQNKSLQNLVNNTEIVIVVISGEQHLPYRDVTPLLLCRNNYLPLFNNLTYRALISTLQQ